MSTVPMQQQQQTSEPDSNHASVAPVIVVLIVVAILGIISAMVGRLCSGRRVFGFEYDFEGWLEKKCASCIDGRIDYHPQPRQQQQQQPLQTTNHHNNNASSAAEPVITIAIPTADQCSDEGSQSEQSSQNPHAAKDS